jgi:hypothetical protein
VINASQGFTQKQKKLEEILYFIFFSVKSLKKQLQNRKGLKFPVASILIQVVKP